MATNETAIPPEAGGLQNNYLVQAWLVLLLAIVFGTSLAGVQQTLGPVIEANKVNETLEKVPEVILGFERAEQLAQKGENLVITPRTIVVETAGQKKGYPVFEARYPDLSLAGWVTKASGQGYADKIELLMGFDPHAKHLTGLFILEQKETPGLGNKIIEKKWRDQFLKKSTDARLRVVKGGAKTPNDIDAITGATISSKAVVAIINKSAAELEKQLASLAAAEKKDR